MLQAIVRFSLRFRGIVIALACALLGYGVYSLTLARYSVFPEFAPPQVVIQTEAPGLAPEQVEVLVTQPLENAINGVSGIDSLRSGSIQGLSVITVVFRPASDIYVDRQVVAERLAAVAGQLPAGVEPPRMTPTDVRNRHGPGGGTYLEDAVANGLTHDCRLDGPATAAGCSRRCSRVGFRRRSEANTSPIQARPADSVQSDRW